MFPRLTALHTGRQMTLIILLDMGLGFAVGYLVLLLGGLYPGRPFSDYILEIYGRVLGKVLLAVSIVLFLLPVVFSVRSLGEVLVTIYLGSTPLVVVMGVVLAAAVYANQEVFPVIARVAWVILVATVLVYVLALGLSFSNIQEPMALVPAGPWNLRGDAVALYQGAYVYAGQAGLLQILPFLRRWDFRLARRYLFIGFGVGALLLCLEFVVTVGALGLQGTAYFVWPAATVLRLVAFPGFFIDRFGYLVLIGLAGMVFVYQAIWIRATAIAMDDLFNGERQRIHLMAAIAGGLILAAALLPDSEAGFEKMVFAYLSPWLTFFYWIFLPLTLALAHYRRRRSERSRSMV